MNSPVMLHAMDWDEEAREFQQQYSLDFLKKQKIDLVRRIMMRSPYLSVYRTDATAKLVEKLKKVDARIKEVEVVEDGPSVDVIEDHWIVDVKEVYLRVHV